LCLYSCPFNYFIDCIWCWSMIWWNLDWWLWLLSWVCSMAGIAEIGDRCWFPANLQTRFRSSFFIRLFVQLFKIRRRIAIE
jgi:hypothetical protein